ncbi:hypothetical protein FGG08_004429 [Glutinoglossum americanum]|uniref:DUF7924 domain-containing protein n=1 Tax=Glutinoglossum americanum TaxID=1670608 RepID=A0A9P8IBH2_9PEZI|nr:hypothetical protein FGG08_004429 [Glutinoglossum americanum]
MINAGVKMLMEPTSSPLSSSRKQTLEKAHRPPSVAGPNLCPPQSAVLPLTWDNLRRFDMASLSGLASSKNSGSSTPRSPRSAIAERRQLSTNLIHVHVGRGIPSSIPAGIRELIKRMKDIGRPTPDLTKADKKEIRARVVSIAARYEDNATDALLDLVFAEPCRIDRGAYPPHLGRNRDCKFIRGCVPTRDALGNAKIQAALDRVGAPKTPKPDIAFGYSSSAFSIAQALVNTAHDRIAHISQGILHPFIVLEGKSGATGGTQIEVQNRAARSAAALVHSQRTLHASAHGGDFGSPADTACFSCTTDSTTAYVWIHWCQEEEGEPHYRMKPLLRLFLDNCKAVWKLRQVVDNIFEWGLGERLERVKAVLDRIPEERAEAGGSRKRKR